MIIIMIIIIVVMMVVMMMVTMIACQLIPNMVGIYPSDHAGNMLEMTKVIIFPPIFHGRVAGSWSEQGQQYDATRASHPFLK